MRVQLSCPSADLPRSSLHLYEDKLVYYNWTSFDMNNIVNKIRGCNVYSELVHLELQSIHVIFLLHQNLIITDYIPPKNMNGEITDRRV